MTKNDTHYGHNHLKSKKHKLKALKQFRALKKTYKKSIEDARQMFLEYIGSSLPCSDTDVEKVREEYEQQIAQLNDTIASQQQQLTDLNATIASQQQQLAELNTTNASQQQQLAGLNATIASQQQQLEAQAAAHQEEMNTLTQQCNEQIETAYNDGMETCASAEPAADPQQVGSWTTGTHYPYALDVDDQGNTYIVDKNNRSVVGYDSTGTQITAWTSATLMYPVDLAVDSQGAIYILDQANPNFLQKFSPNGQRLDYAAGWTFVTYPQGLFIDSQDNIYVTDMGGLNGGRILKFDSTGALAATFGEVTAPELAGQEYCDIAVDEVNQNIYIVTRYNHMVAKFDMDGAYLGAWQGDLSNPNSIAIGAQGQVFVADTDNNQVDQYDADGNLTYTMSSSQLNRPSRIVVDDSGKLYIAVESYQTVQVYQ